MYAVTGMSLDSSDVRSVVSAFAIGLWYSMRSSVRARSTGSDTHDRLGAGAVELDLRAIGRLAVRERRAHRAGHLELAADDADVAANGAARAHDAGELVVDRREERCARVAHHRDDALGAGVHQREHVVGTVEQAPDTPHGCRVEHLRSPPHLLHASDTRHQPVAFAAWRRSSHLRGWPRSKRQPNVRRSGSTGVRTGRGSSSNRSSPTDRTGSSSTTSWSTAA